MEEQVVVVNMVGRAIILIIICSLPIVLTAMIIGFSVSVLQAITQVQEQTLSFVPKSMCVYAMIILLSPWLLNTALEFITTLYSSIPTFLFK